ncbi:MAG: hypothetical protein V7K55_09850 [Nostoc sp.]|uniref:hypothetical protein n=1 Tax=Nostoc sp. TaxID=1180 RepID=UPI002FFB2DC7
MCNDGDLLSLFLTVFEPVYRRIPKIKVLIMTGVCAIAIAPHNVYPANVRY